ncbi:hypothetical protein Micbo1qcDRAFT_236924 [Microdochium bolleyi]|uniref:Uncharacterized protein n=1 Tax=Microdochium bolleyi TaxID=196109 RepID=A0A136ING5_9PEZI|nr:hypothetical protein Micbo1qcDRAFT_236924 [Microdochium bolleyi]
MAGRFSYASLTPRGHGAAAVDDDNLHSRQLSPNSLHHATSLRGSARPVSPLESEDGMSVHLDRSVSLATTKSARFQPTVEVHPVIAEEHSFSRHQQHPQPDPYDGEKNDTAGPYGAYSTIPMDRLSEHEPSAYRGHNQHHYSTDGVTYGNTYPTNQPSQTYQQDHAPSPPTHSIPPEQTPSPPKIPKYRIWREWKWEIATLVALFALLLGLGILLRVHDKARVPDWGRYVNLNTVLALMSTFFRAGLVFVLSQIIAQRKWSWFAATEDAAHHRSNKPRPLGHIEKFDGASRNPFKAFWLFTGVLHGRDLISLGAAVLFLVSFLVGPFVQQASQTEPCTKPGQGGLAALPMAQYVPREGGFIRGYPGKGGEATSDTIVALLSTATAPRGVENRVGFTCETGNCTFNQSPDPAIIDGEKANRRRRSTPATSSQPLASADLALPFLGSTTYHLDNLTAQADFFLSKTHSTVGVCSYCSDISSSVKTTPKQTGPDVGSLAGMNVSRNAFGTVFNMSSAYNISARMEQWLGSALSPEHGMTARYALHNTTMLMINDPDYIAPGPNDTSTSTTPVPDSFLAAACHMYPCLRTFSSAVRSGELVEAEAADSTSKQPLKRLERQFWPAKMGTLADRPRGIDMSSDHGSGTTWSGSGIFYATIKSPCSVWIPWDVGSISDNHQPVYTRANMSSSPIAVDMIMYQPRILDDVMKPLATGTGVGGDDPQQQQEADYHWVHYRAPEACIYRHAYNFHRAVGSVLRDSILSGSCKADPRTGPACTAPISVIASTLEALYAKGAASTGSIEAWFRDFADAVTARYRFQFGAATWNNGTDELVGGRPPLEKGQVRGEVWLTVVCIAMDEKWLRFPLALLLATAVLLVATVYGTWRHRHHRPVWKDSVLPMLFYNAKFSQGGLQHGQGQGPVFIDEKERGDDYHHAGETPDRLLEAREMQKIADRTMVTFDWPGSTLYRGLEHGGDGHSTGAMGSGQQQDGNSGVPQPRRPFLRMPWQRRMSVDSLLDNNARR